MAGRWTGLLCSLLLCSLAFGVHANSDGMPDLAISGVVIDPVSAYRGMPVAVSFELSYVGEAGQIDSVVVELTCRRADLERDCLEERKVLQLTGATLIGSFMIETSEFPPGGYEISVRVDPDNDIAEASETNNRAIAHLQVESPLPDLVPMSLEVDPRSPIEVGATVRFSSRIANTGSTHAGEFVVICEIASLGEAWTPVGSVRVPGLERDDEIDARFPFTVAAEGTYDLRIRVDSGGAVTERDEANNQLTTRLSVVPNVRRRPDLQPISLTLSPSSPLGWLEDATATVVIVNTGGVRTAGPVEIAFYYRRVGTDTPAWQPLKDPDASECDPAQWDIAVRSPSHGRPLSIEEDHNTEVLTVPISLADHEQARVCEGVLLAPRILPGDYELKVVVDPIVDVSSPAGKEIERYENNNELVIGFSILGSELQPESLELSQSSVPRGTAVVVKASVRNTGAKAAEAFTVGFYVDAKRLDTYYYIGQGLATNGVVSVQGVIDTQDLVEGNHVVRVLVDPDDQLPERDEANNAISAPLEVQPLSQRKAELFVDRIEFEPGAPIPPGYPFRVRVAVNNAGDLAAEEFDVILRLEKLSDVCAQPNSPALAGSLDVALHLPMTVERLEPLETIWLEWTLAGTDAGVYGVQIEVDPPNGASGSTGGQVPERDDANNLMSMDFGVCDVGDIGSPPSSEPNLECRGINVFPTNLNPGEPITILATIVNSGGEPAAASVLELSWTYPTGYVQKVESTAIPGLSPGGSFEFTRTIDTVSFPYGSHRVSIHADAGNAVPEASENDNQCYATVRIGAEDGVMESWPDLVPVSVRFDSPGSMVGENNSVEQSQRLYAYVTVRNDGTIPSGPFAVAFETSLGVEVEQWTGIGPQDQVEVSHPVPTGVPGGFALSIDVDPDNLIPEANETNNAIPNAYVAVKPVYTVVGVVKPKPERIGWSDSAVRALAADAGSQHVYVVWANGEIGKIRVDDNSASIVTDLALAVTDVTMTFGSVPYAYVAATDGSFRRVNLETRAVSGEANLGSEIVAIALGDGGRVYAAIESGFHELTLSGSSYAVSRLVSVPGDVIDIRYDSSRQLIYVLSNTGLHGYGIDLASRCLFDEDETVGAPATLTLGGSGNYLGTSAGSGGILYAISHCTLTGATNGHILAGWRYPRTGSLPGRITSVVIDPRDIDPIYVATEGGSLYSLGFDGIPQWVYETGAPIHSTPLADKRTGRVFFGDDEGIPHILTLSGADAFEIDLTDYGASPIRSTLVILETRERTDFGTRLIRNYYYGTEAGDVYKIASQQ